MSWQETMSGRRFAVLLAAIAAMLVAIAIAQPAYADDLKAEGVAAQNSAGLRVGDSGYTDDGQWEYEVLPGRTAAITYYLGRSSSVVIPANVDGLKVTTITSLRGMYRYSGSSKPVVKSITIPKTVTKIGEYAGYTASDWKNEYVPVDMKGVLANEVNVFYNVGREISKKGDDVFVPSLKSINVAKGNKKFKSVKGVLFNKKGTKLLAYPNAKKGKYKIPKKVKSVAPYAFQNAEPKKVVTSKKMKKIGAYAFADSEIKAISFKGKVKSIGKGAFAGAGQSNQKFKSIRIPSSVKSIGESAFSGASIKKVSIANGVKKIGRWAFSSTNLKKVKIPGSVRSLDMFAFANNPQMSKVTLKNGLKTVGVGAFSFSGIKKITIPKSVKKLASSGAYAETYTSGDKETTRYEGNPFVVMYRDTWTHNGKKNVDEHYYLSHSSRCYDKNENKKGAKSSYALVDRLKTIKVAKGNKKYAAKKGVLFNKKMTTLIAYPMAKKGSKYTLPKKVKAIAAGAFAFNQKLKAVKLNKKLKRIGDFGFAYTGISAITLPSRLSSAGYGAFNSYRTVQNQLAYAKTGNWARRSALVLTAPSAVASRLHYTVANQYDRGNSNVTLVIR